MKFTPVVDNKDLWINPDPQGPWARVAVCSRWQDAAAAARRWKHKPAVVGPLRTEGGLDLLVRSLLANPQIRVVFVDGPDLLPGNGATKAAESFFRQDELDSIGEDVKEFALLLNAEQESEAVEVALGDGRASGPRAVRWTGPGDIADAIQLVDTTKGVVLSYMIDLSKDRSGGAHVLPPPPPKATALAGPGDPGERISANTLGELWPQLLLRTLRFGRTMPTQYGYTKELLNVVSVIRDPRGTIDEFLEMKRTPEDYDHKSLPLSATDPTCHLCGYVHRTEDEYLQHPVLGRSLTDVLGYYAFVTGEEVLKGAPYTYGSRLHGHGAGVKKDVPTRDGQDIAYTETVPVDQFVLVGKLLEDKPDTRAAFLTPWRPDEDSGKESGRPCLTGVWFRVTPREPRAVADEAVQRGTDSGGCVPLNELNMTVMFRSHDLYGAYAMNLAAICLWLVKEAERLGHRVGSLTCISCSAHVYARDWNVASELADAWKPKGLMWDERSSWRIEKVQDPKQVIPPIQVGDTARMKLGAYEGAVVLKVIGMDFVGGDGYDDGPIPVVQVRLLTWLDRDGITHDASMDMSIPESIRARFSVNLRGDMPVSQWRELTGHGPRFILRALALEPKDTGTGKTLAVIEAASPGALRSKIERSGLVTSIGSALWIGEEIERVHRG